MALQELSPQPQITGYTALGNVINQSARDWRERAQHVQDVGAAREYASGEAQKASDRQLQNQLTAGEASRKGQLSNETAMMALRSRAAILTALQAEGLLRPGEENDMAKVAAAYQEFQARGLEKIYGEMLTALDENGKPFLTDAQVGIPAEVKSAKDRFFAYKGKQIAFKQEQGPAAVKDLTNVTQQEAAVQQQMEKVFDAMQKIPTEPPNPATPDEIQKHAYDLAMIQNSGKAPAPKQVAAMFVQAQKDLDGQRQMAFYQAQKAGENLRNQYGALNQQLTNLRQTKEAYIRQGYAPAAGQAPSASTLQQPSAAAPVAPKVAGPADIAQLSQNFMASLQPSQTPDAAPAYSGVGGIVGAAERAPEAVNTLVALPESIARSVGNAGASLGNMIWTGSPTGQIPQAPLTLPTPQAVQSAKNIAPPTGIQQMIQDTKTARPVGRPITSAPQLFPTDPNWWQARGLPVPAGL